MVKADWQEYQYFTYFISDIDMYGIEYHNKKILKFAFLMHTRRIKMKIICIIYYPDFLKWNGFFFFTLFVDVHLDFGKDFFIKLDSRFQISFGY